MREQQLTLPRLLTMVGFALSCFGLLLFLWLSFGGASPMKPKGYRVDVLFGEATQLADQADVRVSGVPVGKVVGLERDGDRTRATLELQSRYSPVRSDARAVLRQKTLLGETYVELTPGTRAARPLAEGTTLARGNVQETVELDEVLQAFDEPSRRDLQAWLQGWSRALDGRAQDLSDAVGTLGPLAADGGDLVRTMAAQRGAVAQLVRDAGTVFGTIGERDASTRELVTAGRTALETTAARRTDLQATVRALPPFLEALGAAARAAVPLSRELTPSLAALRPVARDLEPTLRRGAQLGDDLGSTAAALDPVITAAREGLPAATRLLAATGPVVDRLRPLASQLSPVAAFLNAYRIPFTQSWGKVAAATNAKALGASGRDINYLRLTAPILNETLALADKRWSSNRANPYPAPDALPRSSEGRFPAFDCSHLGNGGTPPVAGSPPPCLQQEPFDAGGGTSRFPVLRPSSR